VTGVCIVMLTGEAVMVSSLEEPLSVIPQLKVRGSRLQSLMYGYYRFEDDLVTVVVKKRKTNVDQYSRPRKNRAQDVEKEQTYHVVRLLPLRSVIDFELKFFIQVCCKMIGLEIKMNSLLLIGRNLRCKAWGVARILELSGTVTQLTSKMWLVKICDPLVNVVGINKAITTNNVSDNVFSVWLQSGPRWQADRV
jgi:hypothetical protein